MFVYYQQNVNLLKIKVYLSNMHGKNVDFVGQMWLNSLLAFILNMKCKLAINLLNCPFLSYFKEAE